MDHHEQHHQHHEKEREEHKKQEKERDKHATSSGLPFHPAWFVAIGVALVAGVVLVWTLAY